MKKRIGTVLIAFVLLLGVLQYEESAKENSNVLKAFYAAFEGPYHVGNREYMDVAKQAESDQSYEALPKRLRKAYRQLDEYVYKFYDDIDDIVIPKDDFRMVLEYYRADHPQAFWLSSAYRYQYDEKTDNLSRATLFFTYEDPESKSSRSYTQRRVEKMCRELDEAADRILEGITEEMSEYEKVLYLHDYLAENVAYDASSPNQHDAYGALVEKKAVCDGYALGMQYLLLKAGMDCRIVYGDDREDNAEHHAWNVVRVDGEYYHLDVTWDVPPAGTTQPIYANFLVSTEEIKKRHIIFSPISGADDGEESIYPPVPDCTDDSLSYYQNMGLYVSDLTDESIAAILLKANAALISGDKQVQFQFASQTDLQEFIREARENVPRVARGFPYSCDQYQTEIVTCVEDNILILQYDYS